MYQLEITVRDTDMREPANDPSTDPALAVLAGDWRPTPILELRVVAMHTQDLAPLVKAASRVIGAWEF